MLRGAESIEGTAGGIPASPSPPLRAASPASRSRSTCARTLGARALLAGASCLCYSRSLQGEFMHDDVWAIVNNPDVRPGVPLSWGIFSNDFWGKGMAENTRHKSYRPLCVLAFKFSRWCPEKLPDWLEESFCILLRLSLHASLLFTLSTPLSSVVLSPRLFEPLRWFGRRGLGRIFDVGEGSLRIQLGEGSHLLHPHLRPHSDQGDRPSTASPEGGVEGGGQRVTLLPGWSFLRVLWTTLQMGECVGAFEVAFHCKHIAMCCCLGLGEAEKVSKTVKSFTESLPCLHPNNYLASFIDAGRKQKLPGSDEKYFITLLFRTEQSAWASC